MNIDLLTKADLEQFKNEILKAIESKHADQAPAKKWLRSKEVREMLGISTGTLQNLRIKGILTPKKIEGVLFYSSDAIDNLLNK